MSRNAGGTYTLPAGNPVVTATIISSSWANTTLSDIATEMTDSLDRSGKGGMLAALQLTDGVVGAPGLTFVTEPTSGLYRISAGLIGLSTLSRLAMSWNTNGQVVINGGSVSGGGALLINLLGTTTNGVLMTGTAATFMQPLMVRNLSNANTAINYGLEIANDTAGKELYFFNTSTTFNTAILTGIPALATCGIVALNNQFAISAGVGNQAHLLIDGVTNVTKLFEVTNNVGTPAGSMLQAATEESGSFTGTLTGCTTSPTVTINWRRVGTTVTLDWGGALVAVSNTTACTVTGMPAALAPARLVQLSMLTQDNSVNIAGYVRISAGTQVLTLLVANGTPTFTNVNNKGWGGAGTFTYNLA